jgi:ADP-ribose pyrophosphatase YjhB (NUDIX family)
MKQTAGILILSKDKILLCKRTDSEQWAIPMGHMEKGEEPIDCAYREFYEETNLEITDPIKCIGRIKKKNNGKVKSTLHIFLFEVDSEVEPNLEDAQDGHEHSECGYFDIEEIESIDMEQSLKKFILKIFFDF